MIRVPVVRVKNTKIATVVLLSMQVAVAIIINSEQQVLITQRSPKTSHAGFWEFPGGKLESNESAEAALIREIREEVGLEIIKSQFIGQIDHQYDTRFVSLLVHLVTDYYGDAICREEQTGLHWVSFAELSQFNFPAANERIIELITSFAVHTHV